MLNVDEQLFEKEYFERCFERFEQHPVLGSIQKGRLAVCVMDAAFLMALCFYVRNKGGTIFPLPKGLPLDAARRRSERSGCSHLLYDENEAASLQGLQEVEGAHVGESVSSLIQMSSGTTGKPKFIERSWASIEREIDSYVLHFDPRGELQPVVACPVNHSYGLICGVLVALKRGIVPQIVQNLNPRYVLKKCRELERPLLYSSPTLIRTITLLASEEEPLFAAMTSGTLMQSAWFERVRTRVRHLHQQYGCSEAGCISLATDIRSADQIGIPLPHLRVQAGPKTSPGEIVVENQGVMIATKDLGYFEDGQLHFVSRMDDMINVSGLNVYPAEVEEVVLEIPSVRDAVVFKREHQFGSDQVCLNFVADSPLSENQIREWCAGKLAAYQVPMLIAQVDEIPKLPNGKISRRALAELPLRAPSQKRLNP